jgi:hypothetical protein
MKAKHILLAAGLLITALLLLHLSSQPAKVPAPGIKTRAITPAGPRVPTVLQRTDPKGDTWALNLSGGPSFPLADPNGPQAGPPLVVKTDVYRVNAQEASIGLALEGQAGESYRPVVTKNGTRLPAPALRVVSEAGQVIAQGNFSYG